MLTLITLTSCVQNAGNNDSKNQVNKLTPAQNQEKEHDTYPWLSLDKLTPVSFIEAVRLGDSNDTLLKVLPMTGRFPENWVTREDIDTLISLIETTEKCYCSLSPLSSYIPSNDHAEIGGYARLFIQSYKDNERLELGLYSCPKVDKSENEELTHWWTTDK